MLAFYAVCDGFGVDPDGLPAPGPFPAPPLRAEAHRAAAAARQASVERTAVMMRRLREECAAPARARQIIAEAVEEGLHGDASGLGRGVELAVAGLIAAGLLPQE